MDNLNKLLFHPSFNDTISEINRLNIQLPPKPSNQEMDFQFYTYPPDGRLVTNVEEIKRYVLDPRKGDKIAHENTTICCAYDESINKFSGLEGTAFLMSHSLVVMKELDFIPLNLLTFYFYTRSKDITNKSKFIKYSKDPEMDSKKDYVNDKIEFLTEYSPSGSILFIDGPLIGGDVYTFMIRAINKFLSKDIIPIFFVKNSSSNLVTDNIPELSGKFNSDMHWAYTYLKKGQRTNFFKYADRNNPDNAKIFCYIKAFELSPQRVEFHIDTFQKYREKIDEIMDLIYYLILAQGDLKNPQVRPIAIAEKYARDTLRLTDINKIAKYSGLVPTMNQERFGW
ncbi:MAG: DNA double-strand break repair nuclease NurA [Candidatus Methanoperedens sp.]|nr:DNA double-strand break repair nuclease NurA [Candidatus Methanoperedens sp.]